MPVFGERVVSMNAKNVAPEPEYIHEDAPKTPWLKSKNGKLTAIIAGGVVALSAAFGAGFAISHEGKEGFDRHAGSFDHDGDRGAPNGQHPPRPGDIDGGPQGYGGDGKFTPVEPNQSPVPQNN